MKSPAAIELKAIDAVETVQDEKLRALAATYRKLATRLTKYLADIQPTGAVDAAMAMQDIQNVLVESGFYELGKDVLEDGARKALEVSVRTYSEIYSANVQYSDQAKAYLDSLRQSTLSDYMALSQIMASKMQTLATDLSFGATTFSAATSQVEKILSISSAQAETWVATSMASIHRAATVSLGEELGIERYQYVGPNDNIIRKFCADHIDEIRPLTEWKSMSNGQIGTAATMGGGYNCRHRLVPVGTMK